MQRQNYMITAEEVAESIGLTTPPRTIGVRTKACQPACHCSRSIYAG